MSTIWEKAERKWIADVEHRRAVNREAMVCLTVAGIPEQWAQMAIKLIASGDVSRVRIHY